MPSIRASLGVLKGEKGVVGRMLNICMCMASNDVQCLSCVCMALCDAQYLYVIMVPDPVISDVLHLVMLCIYRERARARARGERGKDRSLRYLLLVLHRVSSSCVGRLYVNNVLI